ncbi:DUF4258 domain-containing protein [Patescibacteria group bacterium]|nr:DUF4258 domain-containing protein [Patescibacteria group bacterium]
MIHFTKHAREKFDILKEHKFQISREQVIQTINNPELIDRSRYPLLIAQKQINTNYVLRIVYKKENSNKIIITFYPGRIK